MSDDFLNSLKQTITETAGAVGKKTEDLLEIQKLKNRIRSVQKHMEQEYQRLGVIICQRFADGEVLDEELAKICDEIMELRKQSAAFREELVSRKGQNICPSCGTSNPQSAVFCMQCGAMMPVREEEPEEFVVKEQTEAEAQQEVWEACTEPEACAETQEEPDEDGADSEEQL